MPYCRGGEKKQLRIDYLVVIRSIRNGTKNFNRRFSRSSPILSTPPFPLFPFFSFSLSLFFFFLFQTHFTSEGIPTESNISHRNGRTISTFSELIIGGVVHAFGGEEGGKGEGEGGKLSVVTNSPRFVG